LSYLNRETVIENPDDIYHLEFVPPKIPEKTQDSIVPWFQNNNKKTSDSSKSTSRLHAMARILGESEAKMKEMLGPSLDVLSSFTRNSILLRIPTNLRSLPICSEYILANTITFSFAAIVSTIYPKADTVHLSDLLPLKSDNTRDKFRNILSVQEAFRNLIIFLNCAFNETCFFNIIFQKITDLFEHRERVIFDLNTDSVVDNISDQLTKVAIHLSHASLIGISRSDLITSCINTIDLSVDKLFRDSMLYDSRKTVVVNFSQSTGSMNDTKRKRTRGKKLKTQQTKPVQTSTPTCVSHLASELKVASVPCR